MARVLLACWGSVGDLFPYLAIADRLRALGHTPIVATCPTYGALVTSEGFAFRPLRPDVQPDDPTLLSRIVDPTRGSEVVIRELVVPSLRDSMADVEAAAADVDLLVSHPVTFAVPLVAERRGLPWLASVLAPMSFFSPHDFPALPNAPGLVVLRRLGPWTGRALMALARRATRSWTAPVAALRRELALPPAADPLYEGQFSPHGTLALFSAALGEPQPDWPARTTVTGFPFFNRAIPMPGAVTQFLDRGDPPVVFTLGSSAVHNAGRFWDESLAALTSLGGRALLLAGKESARLAASLPPHILAVDRAPHDQVFPRASVIVHQGGVGTTGQALRAGRPQLVVPHAHDQFDNAFRVHERGVARVLYATQYTAARATTSLRALSDDSSYATRASATARRVRDEDGAGRAGVVILDTLGIR